MLGIQLSVFVRRSRFDAYHAQLESLPLLVSVLDDLQESIVFYVTPMNLPTAFLAFQPTVAIALLVVFDGALAHLAGGRHVE
jgi:hypothetical protein